jgi:hypothetical protein
MNRIFAKNVKESFKFQVYCFQNFLTKNYFLSINIIMTTNIKELDNVAL